MLYLTINPWKHTRIICFTLNAYGNFIAKIHLSSVLIIIYYCLPNNFVIYMLSFIRILFQELGGFGCSSTSNFLFPFELPKKIPLFMIIQRILPPSLSICFIFILGCQMSHSFRIISLFGDEPYHILLISSICFNSF